MLFSRKAIVISFRIVTVICILTLFCHLWNDYSQQHRHPRHHEIFVNIHEKQKTSVDSNDVGLKRQSESEVYQKNDVIRSLCPVFSLGSRQHNKDNATRLIKCKPIPPTNEDCEIADYQYGVRQVTAYYSTICRPVNSYQIIAELCHFRKDSRLGAYDIECNVKSCSGAPINIGLVNDETGLIEFPETSHFVVKTIAQLEDAIRKLQFRKKSPPNFCLITCRRHPYYIKQALAFPPRAKKREKHIEKVPRINVNILLLDSVSRQHFYRKLPISIKTLKRIKASSKSTTSVLDYELFQSIAPRTFPNVRALFSGKVDIDSNDEDSEYGLNDLTNHFKELGYQTLLQEDSCWFDAWGSLLTDNKHIENATWEAVNEKIRTLSFDDYGLTHLSCEAFQQYGKTNQFNDPPKVCYNGHLLPAYYLNYTYQYLQSIEENKDAKPGFLYTHLNTGHESTGKRISQMDLLLADFISKMNKLENTITLIMSDHGPKTTKFAQHYLSGRLEIGHAFLFMLIPNKVGLHLGKDKLDALQANQHIIFSPLDLYTTLKTLDKSVQGGGLLQRLPDDRFCTDVPVYSFMNCLCRGGTEVLENTDSLQWIPEFAIGYLNEQITESLLRNNGSYGYGNCERLIGNRFNKVRLRNFGSDSSTYIVDILVQKYRGEEIFEVVVRVSNNMQHFEVVKWRRVSIYQHFSKCCDKPIDIQLCICRKETQNIRNPGRDVTRLLSTTNFGVRTESVFLDSKCLMLMKRERATIFRTYEITNLCSDRVYYTNFTIKDAGGVVSAKTIPTQLTVKSWFVYYLTTIVFIDSVSEHPTDTEELISYKMKSL